MRTKRATQRVLGGVSAKKNYDQKINIKIDTPRPKRRKKVWRKSYSTRFYRQHRNYVTPVDRHNLHSVELLTTVLKVSIKKKVKSAALIPRKKIPCSKWLVSKYDKPCYWWGQSITHAEQSVYRDKVLIHKHRHIRQIFTLHNILLFNLFILDWKLMSLRWESHSAIHNVNEDCLPCRIIPVFSHPFLSVYPYLA